MIVNRCAGNTHYSADTFRLRGAEKSLTPCQDQNSLLFSLLPSLVFGNVSLSTLRIFALRTNSRNSLKFPSEQNPRVLGRNNRFSLSRKKYSLLNSLLQGILGLTEMLQAASLFGQHTCTMLHVYLGVEAVLAAPFSSASAPGIALFSGALRCSSSSGCGNVLRGSI